MTIKSVIINKTPINNFKPGRVIFGFLVLTLLGLTTYANCITEKSRQHFSLSSVGDFVWLDGDADGIQDPWERGFRGVVVVLYDATGLVLSTTVTDSTGNYLFSGLNIDPTGKTYQIQFKLPERYRFSPNKGNITDVTNSDADEFSGKTILFTLVPGQAMTDIDAGLIGPLATLPLHRLDLTAILHDKKVELKWTAENEMNTSLFIIQRSFDGINYTNINSKTPSGPINTPTLYTLQDDIQSLVNNSTLYYRIKAEDNDHKFAYSNIVPIKLARLNGIQVWPNPLVNDIMISYTSSANSTLDVQLIDATGKTVKQLSYNVASGVNQLSVTDLQELAPGIYFVRITDKKTNYTFLQKLSKQGL